MIEGNVFISPVKSRTIRIFFFCKVQNHNSTVKKYCEKWFHMNGNIIRFRAQTQTLEAHLLSPKLSLGVIRV